MNAGLFAMVPVAIIVVTTVLLLLSLRWRWSIIALAVQYLAVFWLVTQVWPLGLAAVKLVGGWMTGALLGATYLPDEETGETRFPNAWAVFRLVASAFVLIVVLAVQPAVRSWLPAGDPILLGGGVLIAMGLLQLGLSTHPLRVVFGLLTVLSGFELFYAVVEDSVLVAGLLVIVTLGLGLVGSYLIGEPATREETA